jgi:hypothetical protein
VIKQLQAIVEEWVELLLVDGKPLPEGTEDRRFSGKFVVRLSPEIHRKVALKAMARGREPERVRLGDSGSILDNALNHIGTWLRFKFIPRYLHNS